MKKLFPFLRPYRKQSILAPFFKLLEAVFDLLVPLIVKEIIDVGIQNRDEPFIGRMIGVLAAFAVVGLVCAITAQYFAARAAVGCGSALRSALFAKIQHFSYQETDRIGTDTLMTRMTSDINQIQSGINMTLRLLLRSPIIVIGAVICAFAVDVTGALVFAVVIPLLAILVFTLLWVTSPRYHRVQKGLDEVTRKTRENLNGVRVIRAFRREQEETERFERENHAHLKVQKAVGRLSALMNPLTLLLVDGGLIALLLTGAIRVNDGVMTTGAVIALTNYMAQILVELIKFANTFFLVSKASVCAKRVSAILETSDEMQEPTAGKMTEKPDDSAPAVAFSNVSMTYAGNAAPSLRALDLSAKRGEMIGIIGSTGSGKSTLVQLIPRFYDVDAGSVCVLGKDVRDWNTEELRGHIAVVPQNAVLFSGTVRSNLLWGNEQADDQTLWKALEAAQAKEFVAEKGGLDAPVTQKGTNFSGGQRQRLTIARALVRHADILILDDSASALDYATEAALRNSLQKLPDRPTIFMISQRTASIRHADRILVLEEGLPVGCGTHNQLLENCEVYREIYNSQFKKGGETA